MAKVFGWLKAAAGLVYDPRREERLAEQAITMWKYIVQQKQAFAFEAMCPVVGVEVGDERAVAERVYDNALRKAWAKVSIGPAERRSLDIIAGLVRMPQNRVAALEWETCVEVFRPLLADAMVDGVISAEEKARLGAVAAGIGQTTRNLVLHACKDDAGTFLQGAFDRLSARGAFGPNEWQAMVLSAGNLGLDERDLREAIGGQAQQTVEQLLARAKADGVVSEVEQHGLHWLIGTFGLPPAVRAYVDTEINEVNEVARIRAGQLPTVGGYGLQLRAGEVLHRFGTGIFARTRVRKSGGHVEEHHGNLAVTDSRLVFVSSTAGVEINHRKVLGADFRRGTAQVQTSGKGAGVYYFTGDPDRGPLIYEVAIARANQTITARVEGNPSRHIPRDVRQRVWQAYGGRCADCRATDYIEYDHIIPRAKGGSNDEGNVQLLCRRCNLKKSDNI